MKKWIVCILALVLSLGLALSAQAQTENHPHVDSRGHCVCGGAAVGVGDHQCDWSTEWTELSGTVDFGSLPSGNYYLTSDVKLTTIPTIIGDMTLVDVDSDGKTTDADYYTLDQAKTISLCLNGYDLSTSKDRIFKGLGQQSVLNICDCSYDASTGTFGGTVTGGSSTNGGIIYTYSQSQLNIYGGNFTGKAGVTSTNGGLIVVAQDRGPVAGSKNNDDYHGTCNIYNGCLYGGCAQYGGNINVMHRSHLNLYGGTIRDGEAVLDSSGKKGIGGNIYMAANAVLNIQGTADSPVRILNGTAEGSCGNIRGFGEFDLNTVEVTGGSPEVARIVRDGHLVKYSEQYTTLAAAIAGAEGQTGAFVQLCADTQQDLTVDGEVLLDLNGCDLSGISITGKLYGMDSTTKSYDDSNAGTLTPASGAPQVHVKTTAEQVGGIYRYLAVEDSGSYSFHRFYIGITKISLKPSSVGMGYKATFAGDETVKNALDINQGYGYSLWLDGYSPVKRGYPGSKFETTQELTLRIENFLSTDNTDEVNAERAEMDVHATAFVKLNDGTVITSSEVAYNFHEMVQLADDAYNTYNNNQKKALQTLGGSFSQTMFTWDVSNIHHADGSIWTAVDTDGFTAKLTQSGSYYNIKAGSYVLTEDIDLGAKTLKIPSGRTVSICLNGHTMTSSERMLRVYGNFNICDCHHDAQEGSMIGTLTLDPDSGTNKYAAVLYAYYNSETNLYGGNLVGTGQVTSAGVVAVSHDGDETDPAKLPGVFNMYGGTISGGTATGDGGLVTIWNEAVFNLYDGKLYGGTAGSGGGVYAGEGTFNMYGGEVSGNTSIEAGGNVFTTGSALTNLMGGTITGGTAGTLGGGVYVKGGSVNLYEDMHITGNTVSNLYLAAGATMDKVELSSDANVGVTSAVHALVGLQAGTTQGLQSDEAGCAFRVFDGQLLLLEEELELGGQVNTFSVGFSKVCINPEEMGMQLSGFGNMENRLATEIQEDLYVTTIAITDSNNNTMLLAACDLQRPQEAVTDVMRQQMSALTGVPAENIYISASHTHSTPNLYDNSAIMTRYKSLLYERFALSAAYAMADRSAATLQTGSFEVEGLNFTRHYMYTDENGQVQYFGDNFNTKPSGIDFTHVSENDPTMHLLKFVRTDGKDILLANWRAHPTMTGGSTKTVVSADYVGPLRDAVEEQTGMHFVYFQGAAGNVNTNSRITSERHSYTYDQYGQAVATQLVDNLSCLKNVASGEIKTDTYTYSAAVDHSADGQIEDAKYVQSTYWTLTDTAERKALLAEYGFSSVYHAGAVVAKYRLAQTQDLEINVMSIGDKLGFYTAPGELWTDVSVLMEETSPFAKTFTIGYCNGDHKYFLYAEALDYVSYESVYSRYVMPDTIDDMIAYWQEALTELYKG